jgi:hypothetical protein
MTEQKTKRTQNSSATATCPLGKAVRYENAKLIALSRPKGKAKSDIAMADKSNLLAICPVLLNN